jgi:hypothetical protein
MDTNRMPKGRPQSMDLHVPARGKVGNFRTDRLSTAVRTAPQ